MTEHATEYAKIAETKDIPDGEVKVYDLNGAAIALCHVGDKFYAVQDLCTHDGGPLGEGELVGSQIECPRHGARFDVKTGKAMCLPAVIDIPTYEVEVRGGEIFVK
ncbi:MAG: non-heme iron oxygenase ferredoxin subunit [Cyanobacteria bacterium REEB67]|nr:non-heme iron oxygenase ferredoxin subunit [Cyanobacteria bacterium REEB67]